MQTTARRLPGYTILRNSQGGDPSVWPTAALDRAAPWFDKLIATPYDENTPAMPYAIIETGGKQYRVQPGDVIEVERLSAEVGSTIDLDRVLLLAGEGQPTLGQPTVAGARVVAEVQKHDRSKKVIVFKFKPKVRYQRKQGHRQAFTRLAIKEIVSGERPAGRRPRRAARGT